MPGCSGGALEMVRFSVMIVASYRSWGQGTGNSCPFEDRYIRYNGACTYDAR
ncbi:MAG: hypothetical protein F6K53_25500 [Moorea sp. SIO4A1]|nr:hypothetical protein [Moorena sp. SIO4A1]